MAEPLMAHVDGPLWLLTSLGCTRQWHGWFGGIDDKNPERRSQEIQAFSSLFFFLLFSFIYFDDENDILGSFASYEDDFILAGTSGPTN